MSLPNDCVPPVKCNRGCTSRRDSAAVDNSPPQQHANGRGLCTCSTGSCFSFPVAPTAHAAWPSSQTGTCGQQYHRAMRFTGARGWGVDCRLDGPRFVVAMRPQSERWEVRVARNTSASLLLLLAACAAPPELIGSEAVAPVVAAPEPVARPIPQEQSEFAAPDAVPDSTSADDGRGALTDTLSVLRQTDEIGPERELPLLPPVDALLPHRPVYARKVEHQAHRLANRGTLPATRAEPLSGTAAMPMAADEPQPAPVAEPPTIINPDPPPDPAASHPKKPTGSAPMRLAPKPATLQPRGPAHPATLDPVHKAVPNGDDTSY